MKKLLAASAVPLLVGPLGSGLASADRAVVIDPAGECSVIDGTGSIVSTENSRLTITNSANGNMLLRCEADGVTPSPSGHAVSFDAETASVFSVGTGPVLSFCKVGNDPCVVLCAALTSPPPSKAFVLTTDDWKNEVSASGHVTLTCHFKS
jgi:hypothetical protein